MIKVFKDTKQRCNIEARYVAPDGSKHVKWPQWAIDLYLEDASEAEKPEDYSEDTHYNIEVDYPPYREYPKKLDEQIQQAFQNKVNQESLAYLANTDWMATRFAETGELIPEDVKQRRKEARDAIVREPAPGVIV